MTTTEPAWKTNALPMLEYEEAVNGAPCPGCGQPWVGREYVNLCLMERDALCTMRKATFDIRSTSTSRRGKERPLLDSRHVVNLVACRLVRRVGDHHLEITPRGRVELDALEREERRYETQHGSCLAGRMSSGGPMHCMSCCPPPPLSPAQVDFIANMLHNGRDVS